MIEAGTEEIAIGAEPDAVPAARHTAMAFMAERCPHLSDDAALVVSELVTNAQLHGELPGCLRLRLRRDRLRIEVEDRGRTLPQPGGLAEHAVTGRGLGLVSALARDWGVDPVPGGKVVWAELDGSALRAARLPSLDLGALASAWPDREGIATQVTVDLGDVPTRLLLEAKAHVDNLVRELTLAAAGSDSDPAGLPAPVAAMVEGVVHRFAEPRLAIKRLALQAAEQGQTVTRLVLTVPRATADAGEEYLHALDEADRHARAARLLTLATPPAHRVFRRWYVEALVAHIRARSAGRPPPPVPPFEERLLAELDALWGAHARASRIARLQAVTAALAEATTVEEATRVVLLQGVQALGASGGTVFLVGDDGVAVPAAVGYSSELVSRLAAERPGDNLPATTAARTGHPVWIESSEERNALFPEMAGLEPETEAICAVPLGVAGRVMGALRFSFDQAHLFDGEERDFVEALAAQVRMALQRSELVAAERAARRHAEVLAGALADAAERLRMLQRVTAGLTAAPDVAAVAEVVAGTTGTIGADGVALLMLDADRGKLHLRAAAGIMPSARRAMPLATGEAGIIADALRSRSVVLVPAAVGDDVLPGLVVPEGSEAAVAPLLAGGVPLGVLVLAFHSERRVAGAADEAFVTALADACAQALQRAAATAEAEEAARRLALLVDASAALSGARDHVAALTAVVDLLVPGLADGAFVELAQRGGIGPVAVAHRQPALADAVRRVLQTEPESAAGTVAGASSLPAVTGILLRDLADPEDLGRVPARYRRVLGALDAASAMVVPLTGRAGTIGALTLALATGSGRHYGRDQLALLDDIGRRVALAVETATELQRQRGRLAAVTRVAEAAQQAILAPPPPSTGNLSLAARYVSAAAEAQIGGDLYEVVPLPGSTRMLVGDVRGKGLDAVRTATVVLGEFRSAAPDATDLATLARHLDSRVAPYLGPEDFVTAVLAEVAHDGTLRVACCGHPPALLLRDGGVEELGATGSLPLGLGADPRPVTATMAAGDRLLLLTDGLLEARALQGGFVDTDALVARAAATGSVGESLDALLAALNRAVGDELGDDLALLLVEYRPGEP